tara:strand:- start:4797 stop:5396 length:600 start_codon:yes stop_codon:yes gene_type:complete
MSLDSAYDNDYKYLVDILAVLYPVLVIYSIFDQDYAETTRNEKRTLLIKSFILITALIVYLNNWGAPIFYIWSLFIITVELFNSIGKYDSIDRESFPITEILSPIGVCAVFFVVYKYVTNKNFIGSVIAALVTYLIINVITSFDENKSKYSECTFYSILLNHGDFCDDYIKNLIFIINSFVRVLLILLIFSFSYAVYKK